MTDKKTGKIEQLSLTGVSRNKTIFAKLKLETDDEIYGISNGWEYLATRVIGDDITLVKFGDSWRVLVPDAFVKFLSEENDLPKMNQLAKCTNNIYKNFSSSIVSEVFGSQTKITLDEVRAIVKEANDTYEIVRDMVFDEVSSSNFKIDKEIIRQYSLKKSLQTIDPLLELEKKTDRVFNKYLKGYCFDNDFENYLKSKDGE